MRGRGPFQALVGSPLMVGALTVLIATVTVYLAYNANRGLPFVQSYRVSVRVPNGARVTNANDVRIGGRRVGIVESIDVAAGGDDTRAASSGSPAPDASALLNLKLDKAAEPLPQDSIFRVRYRSAFGLKYIEIVRGTGEPAFEGHVFDGTDDDGTCKLPIRPEGFAAQVTDQARNGCFQDQTEFDAINNTFDRATRTHARTNLVEFGSGFAGRGGSLNEAVAALEPLFRGLRPVARTLSNPATRLVNFFPELADAARIVAPVAAEQAEFFGFAARTFEAISADPQALRESISGGVPTLEATIRVLPGQAVFLANLARLADELAPGVADLRPTLPVLNDALKVGSPVLADLPPVNRDLSAVFGELDRLVTQPSTRATLERLGDTFDTAEPLARFVAPAQTVCNYFTYFFTNFANALSESDQVGTSYRSLGVGTPPAPEVESNVAGYAGLSASARQSAELGGKFEPYTLPLINAGAYMPAGQHNADCQPGQRGYPLGQMRLPGQPENSAANMISDLPGSRGPTTLFWNDDQEKELVDTRVASRQPETWRRGR